ncbi:hypothetical protein BASA50_004000 [Batrachochytrium salamandrivorans]|uniref:Uncharacterized protein n=1 Tax=Batrachochytrium salamandrivorans TaxID=1357716 RepID=A0ABQ8FJR8_9FUNG|nr:hypothetical protein BASA50_004000 [Batrachochytrium salamandrivorans]
MAKQIWTSVGWTGLWSMNLWGRGMIIGRWQHVHSKKKKVPAIQKSRLRLLGRALDPGVENVYTWLRGGVLNGEADLDQRWLDGTVEHESMGTRHDNRALAARLADFLQVAYRQYQSTLWKYHRDRLVEVG